MSLIRPELLRTNSRPSRAAGLYGELPPVPVWTAPTPSATPVRKPRSQPGLTR